MNKWACSGLLTVAAFGFLQGMAQAQQPDPADIAAVTSANRAFAVDLYHQLAAKEPEKNIFFSPYSISNALTMLAEGARGRTAEQIAKVLRFNDARQQPVQQNLPMFHLVTSSFNQYLNRPAGTAPAKPQPGEWPGPYSIEVANALWSEKTFPLIPNFVRTLDQYYGTGGVVPVDFIGNPDATRRQINAWCENHTRQKIKDLIPSGTIDKYTRLVLANAVYFKGTWVHPFHEVGSSKQPFHVNSTRSVLASFMDLTERSIPYMETDQFQAVCLAYWDREPGDTNIGMVIILPKKLDSLVDVEKTITGQTVAQCVASMQSAWVHVTIPKFKMTSQFSLGKTLAAMGMPDAFDPKLANLSAISPNAFSDQLFVSSVLHKAYVDVNETGTEAAAATAMVGGGIGGRSNREPARPIEFRADIPFLFMIYHRQPDAVLFMGRMIDPMN
jgi:serpin B